MLFFRNRLGISLESGERVACTYVDRNRECIRKACPYFDTGADLTHPDFVPYVPED